jgi:undecaprenyl phosphate-alpha-L-ara4FN deformylase
MRKALKPTGLRIDVDTMRGTSLGVPRLLDILSRVGIRGTFFFSVGPDNMGRHLLRMLKPAFLRKMLRTRAASLYGWDILIKGTLGPGPRIGERFGYLIRRAASEGHEVGLHAWDHYRWQARIEGMDQVEIKEELDKGFKALKDITGKAPTSSAAPGWRCTEEALVAKDLLPFSYNSDCRGRSIFSVQTKKGILSVPQIPVTLPTYDELIGRDGVSPSNYNRRLLALFSHDHLNVLAVHAEVEGISCAVMFEDFLNEAMGSGFTFMPLAEVLRETKELSVGLISRGEVAGREGWVCLQA